MGWGIDWMYDQINAETRRTRRSAEGKEFGKIWFFSANLCALRASALSPARFCKSVTTEFGKDFKVWSEGWRNL
jgi:hypothetical protein